MKKLFVLTITILIVAMAITACGGDDSSTEESDASSSGQTTLEIIMNDIFFGEEPDNAANPPSWTVEAGSLVSVRAQNNGSLDHNWAIVKAGVTLPAAVNDPAEVEDDILFDIGVVAGGDSYNRPFTAPEAGTYTIICTVAGHYPAMQGTLVVE